MSLYVDYQEITKKHCRYQRNYFRTKSVPKRKKFKEEPWATTLFYFLTIKANLRIFLMRNVNSDTRSFATFFNMNVYSLKFSSQVKTYSYVGSIYEKIIILFHLVIRLFPTLTYKKNSKGEPQISK